MKKIFSYLIIKQSLKSVWFWWLISIILTALNLFTYPTAAGAENTDMLAKFAVGGNGVICITICTILFSNVFLTNEVDRCTLAILLNTPTTRLKILLSKALVYIFFILSISILVGVLGALSPIIHDFTFDYTNWWSLIFLWLLYSFAVGGIAFAIGCLFNKSRYTLGITTVVLGLFYFLNMFAGIESFKFCKYFTLQTLFDMSAAIKGESVVPQMIALTAIAIPFYVIGTIKFLNKDLPL